MSAWEYEVPQYWDFSQTEDYTDRHDAWFYAQHPEHETNHSTSDKASAPRSPEQTTKPVTQAPHTPARGFGTQKLLGATPLRAPIGGASRVAPQTPSTARSAALAAESGFLSPSTSRPAPVAFGTPGKLLGGALRVRTPHANASSLSTNLKAAVPAARPVIPTRLDFEGALTEEPVRRAIDLSSADRGTSGKLEVKQTASTPGAKRHAITQGHAPKSTGPARAPDYDSDFDDAPSSGLVDDDDTSWEQIVDADGIYTAENAIHRMLARDEAQRMAQLAEEDAQEEDDDSHGHWRLGDGDADDDDGLQYADDGEDEAALQASIEEMLASHNTSTSTVDEQSMELQAMMREHNEKLRFKLALKQKRALQQQNQPRSKQAAGGRRGPVIIGGRPGVGATSQQQRRAVVVPISKVGVRSRVGPKSGDRVTATTRTVESSVATSSAGKSSATTAAVAPSRPVSAAAVKATGAISQASKSSKVSSAASTANVKQVAGGAEAKERPKASVPASKPSKSAGTAAPVLLVKNAVSRGDLLADDMLLELLEQHNTKLQSSHTPAAHATATPLAQNVTSAETVTLTPPIGRPALPATSPADHVQADVKGSKALMKAPVMPAGAPQRQLKRVSVPQSMVAFTASKQPAGAAAAGNSSSNNKENGQASGSAAPAAVIAKNTSTVVTTAAPPKGSKAPAHSRKHSALSASTKGNDINVSELDELTALLAQHNLQFKPKPTYVPRTHSVADIKKWEKATGKRWYDLSAEEREVANEELKQGLYQ